MSTTTWKPNVWVAVVLGIVVQPFAFLYLNKPKLFWIYFLISILLAIASFNLGGNADVILAIIYISICIVQIIISSKKINLENSRKWYSRWWGVSTSSLAFIAIIFLFRSFLYDTVNFQSSSMRPFLNPGHVLIVKKYGYGGYGTFGIRLGHGGISNDIKLERGNIYAFYRPNKTVIYVKRLIGMPGDHIVVKGYDISINGVLLKTSLLSDDSEFQLYNEKIDHKSYQTLRKKVDSYLKDEDIVVPDGSYFFLGDNRGFSADSRIWGFIPGSDFVGEVVYVFGE